MTSFENAHIRLKTVRIAAGFKSAKKFCDKYKIPYSTYSLHETGGRNLKGKTAIKYASLLNVNVNWLVTGIGSPYTSVSETGPVSDSKFIELLQYQGSQQIQEYLQHTSETTKITNTTLLCKIIIGMVNILKQLKLHLGEDELSEKALTLYEDIINSSDKAEEQVTMVKLALTTFKKDMQNNKIHNGA